MLRSCHNFELFYLFSEFQNHFFVKSQKSYCDLNGIALSLKINLRRNGILTMFHSITWIKYSFLPLNKVIQFFSYRFLHTSGWPYSQTSYTFLLLLQMKYLLKKLWFLDSFDRYLWKLLIFYLAALWVLIFGLILLCCVKYVNMSTVWFSLFICNSLFFF